jgi:hypothetical protein
LILAGSDQAVKAASGPRIGSSKATIDRTWRRDAAKCFGGICGYYTTFQKPLQILVQYNGHYAEGFDVAFDPNKYNARGPSPAPAAYWRFLTNLLPAGARRKTYKSIANTGGLGGPAYACLYTYHGKTILVAHYLTPDINMNVGNVAVGEDFA